MNYESELPDTGRAEHTYKQLEVVREPVLRRARAASQLTIPHLLPPEEHTSAEELYTPFQSVGAEGVNNIASKLLLSLMQPGAPFFRINPSADIQNELDEMPDNDPYRLELEKALAQYERLVMQDIEDKGDRATIFEALKHIVVTGNALFYQDKDGSRVWPLDRFVVRRDAMGNLVEWVIHESYDYDTLPDDVKASLPTTEPEPMASGGDTRDCDVYTHVYRKGKTFHQYQEVKGVVVEGSKASWPEETLPYVPMRLLRVAGSSYGEGYVSQYFGDLSSLEALNQAIVEGSTAMAKMLFLVKPNGFTNPRTLAEAPNGAIREGNAEDVTVVQSQKTHDMAAVGQRADILERRLARVFLLDSVVARDAERVTAEEIRRMSQMLEDALGGVYTALTQDFQLPYLNRRIALLQKSGTLPRLPKGVTRVTIVTGVQALGRGHDRERLMNFAGTIAQVAPQALAQFVDVRVLIERLAVADGIDTMGLVKTAEVLQQEQQQAMAQQMMAQVTPEAAKAVGGMAQEAAKAQMEQPQQ